jgi:molecular chaperone DnaK (HSP70)
MTFCCFGVFKNGGVEIITNKEGERTTPSIITIIDENTILRGEETMEYLVNNYDSTIYNIKRFIGKDLNNEKIKEELKKENFPFKIISNNENNSSFIEVNKNNKIIKFTFEEISSFIIGKMIESAENYLNKKVKKLVITVPANFNDAQRNCTKQAAMLAGVEVIRIINEPTAAALAYGLHEKSEEINNKIILVFDLGGGTFDVTILKIYINKDQQNLEKNYEILSTSGDKFLGGVDFDNVLVNYFLEEFCKKNDLNIEEVRKDKKSMRKLKISCEKIKRNLSFSVEEETLNLQNFYNNLDIIQEIHYAQFFSLTKGLIERLKETLKSALNNAKITEDKISEVVLVGGSTRLPMVKNMLKKVFKNSKINDSINPDETVAVGATLMAAKILNKTDNLISSFNLMDITPLSLGIELINENKGDKIRKEGGIMDVIIKRLKEVQKYHM